MSETVAIIGASPKETRYSYKALEMLAKKGHTPIPVAPGREEICGRTCYPSLSAVPEPCCSVTIYISPGRQASLIDELCSVKPKRVIFNPGTENPTAYPQLEAAGIEVVEGCTLVMLATGQF